MAETKSFRLDPAEIDKIINDYKQQRKAAANIVVEFSGVNDIDVLVLLKIMSKDEPSVDDIARAAEIMLDGQRITFLNNGESIFALSYNRGQGNALHLMFTDKAYLYDVLQQTVYALMLKKLTPHLESSN